MKDLYSFHESPESLAEFYKKAMGAYANVFKRLGLHALLTEADGGTFSEFSHEFQVETDAGEDIIYVCKGKEAAVNDEIATDEQKSTCTSHKASEVGNIFELKTKYSEPFELKYQNVEGEEKIVYMGCYGIGISRLLGVLAEVLSDEQGLVWPESIAPFKVHLLVLTQENESVFTRAEKIYDEFIGAGVEVLFDDRDKKPGEKFMDADLIGIPYRVLVSEKTGENIEVKKRAEKDSRVIGVEEFLAEIKE